MAHVWNNEDKFQVARAAVPLPTCLIDLILTYMIKFEMRATQSKNDSSWLATLNISIQKRLVLTDSTYVTRLDIRAKSLSFHRFLVIPTKRGCKCAWDNCKQPAQLFRFFGLGTILFDFCLCDHHKVELWSEIWGGLNKVVM